MKFFILKWAGYEILTIADFFFTAGNDWFCFFDVMHQHITQSQMYATMAYLPYNFVATHLYFAASAAAGRVKIAYPTQEFESKSDKLKSNQILQRLVFKRFILLLIFLKIIILENHLCRSLFTRKGFIIRILDRWADVFKACIVRIVFVGHLTNLITTLNVEHNLQCSYQVTYDSVILISGGFALIREMDNFQINV